MTVTREARARHQRTLRRRRREKGGLPAGDRRHGSTDGYDGWGCRCAPCTRAKKIAEASRPVRAEQHGTTTGYRRGCRCTDCVAASSRYKKAAYRASVLAGVLLLLAGCGPAMTPRPMASNAGLPLSQVRWCDDPHGNSSAGWPCQWNRRQSPAPGWDPTVPNIAIFVRAADGCPAAVDTGNQPWSCYWRPQDQAGATP